MTKEGVGQGKDSDKHEDEVGKSSPTKKTFGKEGTNKTQPKPDPNAKPSDVGNGGKFIESTPFVR